MRRAMIDEQQAQHARNWLQDYRQQSQLSTKQIAEACCVSTTLINAVGNSTTAASKRCPSITTMTQIARLLGTTFDDLCGPPETPASTGDAELEHEGDCVKCLIQDFFDEIIVPRLNEFTQTHMRRVEDNQRTMKAIITALASRGVKVEVPQGETA